MKPDFSTGQGDLATVQDGVLDVFFLEKFVDET